jgi:HAD superfamily phosphatase (TIGR01668 family)
MILYPKLYCRKVTDITPEYLNQNNIKGLILDVDNTLLDFDLNILDGLGEWAQSIKNSGIKSIILSNSNKLNKIKMVAELMNIPYISFATKPLKRGFKKAKEILELPNENIAVIGDQIFTDVVGANRCHMFPILVEPIDKKDLWMTRIKRPLENLVIKKYLKDRNEK